MKSKFLSVLCLFFCFLTLRVSGQQEANEEGRGAYKTRTLYNLEKYWDSDIVCNNPHKGWEFHYFDNCRQKEIPIRLALKESRLSDDGYYKMGEIIVR